MQAASRQAGQSNSITASIRHYGATARARFEACADFDAKRAFLRDYVERIVFDRGRITILALLQLNGATPRTLPFRIEGEIAKGFKRRWAQDERFRSRHGRTNVVTFLDNILRLSGTLSGRIGSEPDGQFVMTSAGSAKHYSTIIAMQEVTMTGMIRR